MPPGTLLGDLGGGLPSQFGVWPSRVVAVLTARTMGRACEVNVVLLAFVPQTTVQALHKAVLHRLTACGVMPLDPTFQGSAQGRRQCQFRPIVAEHRVRHAANTDQIRGHPCPR